MRKFNLHGEEYNLTQLAKRWGVSINTCARVVNKVGAEKGDAYYIDGEPLDGEIYKYRKNVTFSDGKTYTISYLASQVNMTHNNLHYLLRKSKDSAEFERKYKALVEKKSNQTYKLSNGTELSLIELEKLWGTTRRNILRYINIHGIEQAEKYYTCKLKRRFKRKYKKGEEGDAINSH